MSPKGNKFQHRQLRLIQTSIRPDLISVRDSSGKSVHPTEKVQLFVLPPDDAAPEAWLTRVQGLDVLRLPHRLLLDRHELRTGAHIERNERSRIWIIDYRRQLRD